MIKKINHKYYVYDEKGKKKLSKAYSNYHDALKRLRQIEYFKYISQKKSKRR